MRRGVTLIELLTVLAILSLLSSMVLLLPSEKDEEVMALRQAATDLKNSMRKARSLALRAQQTYAITFNISSPDDKVLRNFLPGDPKNFKGRHWYAIVAPVAFNDTKSGSTLWMPPDARTTNISGSSKDDKLASLAEKVRQYQVGGRRYLPRGTRFLALSDYDGACAQNQYSDSWDDGAWARKSQCAIYPIPWHGTIIQRDNGGDTYWRLFSWGFWEDSSDLSDDPDAHRGIPPNTITNYWQKNSNTHSGWCPNNYPHFHRDGVRHVVDGEYMDACLMFQPDGAVTWTHDYGSKEAISSDWHRSGHAQPNKDWNSPHHTSVTGGFTISIARDVDENDPYYTNGNFHQFDSEADALASIVPYIRVNINSHSGVTEIYNGLTGVPTKLHWTLEDGTVVDPDQMDPLWNDVHRFARVQQNQALSAPIPKRDHPMSYHLSDSPFVHFREATSKVYEGSW